MHRSISNASVDHQRSAAGLQPLDTYADAAYMWTFCARLQRTGGATNVSGTRMQLIDDLERTRDATLEYFALTDEDLARTYAPGKWSIRYLLLHLADSETVLFDRIRRVLSEPRQVLWVYDQDAWARGLDYSRVPLDISRRVYEAVRSAIIYYAGQYYERKGHLEFVHSVTGVRTLKDEFDKVASHNAHHLTQIRAALSGRFI